MDHRRAQSKLESSPASVSAPPHRASRGWRAAQVVMLATAPILLGFHVWRTLDYFWFAVRCPFEIEYGEGIVLQNALNIARGVPLYGDYHHYPYVVATYPPFYPLLAAVGAKLFGVSFTFGRVLSSLGALGIGALIWGLLRRSGISRFGAGLAAVLWIAAPIVCWWGPVVRVDIIAVFLAVAGLYCVLRGGWWLVAAVVLMALSMYTRQSEVAPVAAAVGYLWWMRRRRQAVLFGASWVAICAVAFAVLQVVSGGWFYSHVVVANRNFWELQSLSYWWDYVFKGWPFPFVLGAVGVVLALGAWRGPAPQADDATDGRPLRLLGLYFVATMLVSLTAGKIGSTVNYMLAPLAASCLMTGVASHWLAERLTQRWAKAAWVGAWMLVIAVPIYLLAVPTANQYAPYHRSRADIIDGAREAVRMIRQCGGDVLSEDTGLPLLAGKQILLDPHKMTSMFHDGTWDQRRLVADIKRRRFPLIVTRWDPIGGATDRWGTCGDYRWSIGMGHAIMRDYYLVKKAGNLYITAPADADHPSCGILHARLVQEREQRKQRERSQ
jgi:hypothetical protein